MKDVVIQMADVFKALGEPTRLKIIKMLASNPERKLCVGAIARKIGISQPAVSQHLKVLKSIGLVEPNRNGYHVHYAINTEMLAAYKESMDELFQLAFEPCSCNNECQETTE